MPSEDEIRCYQAEHPLGPAMKELLSSIPKIKFDPEAMRRKLTEQFRNETLGTAPGPDKDYPYVKDPGTPGPIRPLPRRCVICGTSLSPAGNCPRCLNLIV